MFIDHVVLAGYTDVSSLQAASTNRTEIMTVYVELLYWTSCMPYICMYVCMCVCVCVYIYIYIYIYIYRVSQEECTKLRESVPNVKLYRYNPKHLFPKLNGYGDNGQRSLKL